MGRPTTPVSEVRIAGPLAPFAADFKSALHDAGYTPLSAVPQLRLTAHLSRWLEEGHLTVADLTGERVEAYLRARRAGHTELCTRRALRPLLDFLAARCVLPADPPTAPGSPADVVLASFGRYRAASGAWMRRPPQPPTIDKLHALALTGMARALVDQLERPDYAALSLPEPAVRPVGSGNLMGRAIAQGKRFTTTSCGVMSQA